MNEKKNYSIGIDIGTDSVGWAVIKNDLTLVRKRMKIYGNTDKKFIKKNFWGSLLFKEGNTAKDRRLKRTNRRRYQRRRNRILELQHIFLNEISKVDANFFYRLNESFLVPFEKEHSKYPIFATEAEEKEYHKKFPTIYHLRKYLADTTEKADIRFIYLALAHIIKYRGHFLIEGNFNFDNMSIIETYKTFLNIFNETFYNEYVNPDDFDYEKLESILKEKISRKGKVDKILKEYPDIKNNKLFCNFLSIIVGIRVDFKKYFELEDNAKIKFSDENYNESVKELLDKTSEDYEEVFDKAKAVYDSIEISNFLQSNGKKTKARLSSQMVNMYEEHEKQLKAYKEFIKRNLPEEYNVTFKDSNKDGYAGYIEGKANQEKFYKYVKGQMENAKGVAEEEKEYFLKLIEKEKFLRKQRSFYNGVIPYQVHLAELEAIVSGQMKFYPFLKDNFEKIKLLLTFRIPYFVGPLANGNSKYAWIERKNNEKIKPWNFNDIVDIDKSADKFIERLIGEDTYLFGEKVLPKRSLIYQKFAIFNELTKVTYKDERNVTNYFSLKEKKEIFEELFKTHSSVSEKLLKKFIENNYQIDNPIIQGLEEKFNSNFSTYIDLKKVYGIKNIIDDDQYLEDIEEIIRILTVFEDKKMRKKQLSKFSSFLSEEDINKLSQKHYKGWGKLSKKLILGLRDKNEHKTILDYLIYDGKNRNFMQLINDDTLSFKEQIEEYQKINIKQDLEDVVSELHGSPTIKRGVLISLKIVDEIIKIMGYNPSNIVIEMARENQTTKEGKDNSKKRIKKIQDSLKKFGSELLKENKLEENVLNNDKLYLYYLQNGKDMYTGEDIDILNLKNYDIDHIIPRSFIVDNSIDNIVLTNQISNRGKLNDVPSKEVIDRMKAFWIKLLDCKLISERKFSNLTKADRGGLTEQDKDRFINRQLVETRQITKNVAEILNSMLNSKENEDKDKTEILLLKAKMASDFRKTFGLYKIRELNDIHHANDAYINALIAIKLLEFYPSLANKFVYGKYIHKGKHIKNKATCEKNFMSNLLNKFKNEYVLDEDGVVIWDRDKDIAKIRKVLLSNQVNVVKKVEEGKGKLYKETINKKGDSDALMPIKNNLNTKLYGGFIEESTAYFVAIKYLGKKNKLNKTIVSISIKDRKIFEKDSIQYLETLGFKNPKVLLKLKKYALFELYTGERRLLTGATKQSDNSGELQKANQMSMPPKLVEFLYKLKHLDRINKENETNAEFVKKNMYLFDEVLQYIVEFSNKYIKADSNIKKVQDKYKSELEKGEIDIEALANSFIQLLKFTKCGAPSEFKFLGENVSRKRYNSLGDLWKSEVIYQSLTGLYETRIDMGKL